MSYEILRTAKGLSILHITTANLNLITGWRIEFDNGKEAMLYHNNQEWIQLDEQWLDSITLLAVGNCIDISLVKRNSATKAYFFYDILNN